MSFLYREAGRVLQGVEEGRASLKTLTLGRGNTLGGGKGRDEDGPKRKLYAMVSETLRYKPLLDKLILKADPKGVFFSDEHVREKSQGYVMLYEMLLGKGSIQGGGKLKRHLVQYHVRLQECLEDLKHANGLPAGAATDALLPQSARRHIFPRYARVNRAARTEDVEIIAQTLRKDGHSVKIDDVVPTLLVLPAGTDLHDHPMVKDGRLVLQDKSSCFSAEALLGREAAASAREAGREWKCGDVIDACAAPGNKTMHAASLLCGSEWTAASAAEARVRKRRQQKVFAFDKDPRRLALMRRRVEQAGMSDAIETRLQDFLRADPADKTFARVTAILLDPSCSGSGIVSEPGRIHDKQQDGEEEEEEAGMGDTGERDQYSRVGKLAAFQLQGLLKAMSFPQVQRICYSTCSVHEQENEDVVAKALELQPAVDAPEDDSAGVEKFPVASRDCTHDGDVRSGCGEGKLGSTTSGVKLPRARAGRFELSTCLSKWPRRGHAASGLDEPMARKMVRTDPSDDETNGFFVAVLERHWEERSTLSKRRNRHKNRDKKKQRRKRKREELDGDRMGPAPA